MSLEDNFHNLKDNQKTLCIKINPNKIFYKNIITNIESHDMLTLINSLCDNNINNIYHNNELIDIKKNTNNIIEIYVNHSLIGGSNLIKFIEVMIGQVSLPISNPNLLFRITSVLYNIPSILNLYLSKSNNISSTNIYNYKKIYNIQKSINYNRKFWTYYTVFKDALIALNKNTIKIALIIPFNSSIDIKNNVGIIFFDFNNSMTIDEFKKLLVNKTDLAIATNTLSSYMPKILNYFGINGINIREKFDIMCSSYFTNIKSPDGKFSFDPNNIIYEKCYISLYTQYLGDGLNATTYASVTTNDKSINWKKVNYK